MAELFQRAGDRERADDLRRRADRLYSAFNQEFWLPDQKFYALCRQANGRFSKCIASNPAHALWTGIIAPEHARDVVRQVMQPDMFSGWGIRTLSAKDRSYNPIDYQVGSVWPHDNGFIVAGMRRYGFSSEANRIFTGLMEAAAKFEHFRLPETFAGYDRDLSNQPVQYPVACNPQAWAAGTIPYMLQAALGLQPDAFNRRLRVVQPHLPDWLHWVVVRDLQVGVARVDLRFERAGACTLVAVLRKEGDLTVSVEY
jgi:glycogen debranching enzyme